MTAARRVLVAAGALGMAYALIGAFRGGTLLFLIAVLIAHDAVLLPLILAAGAVIARFVRPRWRGPVSSALLASLAVTVVAFPLVLGRGRNADNPSVLPLPYGRGLLEIYALIWATAAIWAWHRRHTPKEHTP